jgi:hypothetical protein
VANGYRGEKKLTLYHVDYKMVVNMATISEFQSETGADFMHVAIKAINAFHRSKVLDNPLDRAQFLTDAIKLDHAAWLFYICAKAGNSNVEFGEIQEALIMEGALEKGDNITYPILFVDLVEFAIAGVVDDVKKKNSKE